ncbi:hypothetical protein [Corynebacterium heidelbergense]|uniref:Uncharacterized protein n=1 Tax=Corynebacterium heidelbergense TaxID=2055947 RepID=A0A364VDF7_9CORY|nr:hypothetical protein [Corynebacterium heidelbergense]RAV34677.1 hypothetical protein CWC39_02005 [Corynebacterium heidelbergense]WCZ36250.1 hypothetical protein CHEID_03475 [Corynebacterium heidelbergense]
MNDIERLEQRVDYLSTQVERLIDLHQPFPAWQRHFRKAAMLTGQTLIQEVHARRVLAYVMHRPSERANIDLTTGLVPLPEKTQQLLLSRASEERIADREVHCILTTVVGGGESGAEQLFEAWQRDLAVEQNAAGGN